MLTFAGYQLTELLYESSNSHVYRGYQPAVQRPVVVKLLEGEYPSPEKIARFKREYEITHNLALSGVVKVFALENDQNHWAIILEDFGAESLVRLNLAGQLTLPGFLNLAIKVSDIVGQIHRQHIIHKDINPSNIIFNPQSGIVKIIDFGISTVLSRENTTFHNPAILEGTLAYISPEQTGRMNRAIDYRTDFYSLGVTFYELLTEQLPFTTKDPLELVHCHIAQLPAPPHVLKPYLPRLLSELILKLMAKNAEARYQSAYGLKADLEECLRRWQVSGDIEPFPLGQHDIVDQFQIPQKLYGREQEIALLLAAFDRVAAIPEIAGKETDLVDEAPHEPLLAEIEASSGEMGKSELMLVAGYPGIGKSALVQEIYKPITYRRGYFISGKFDQFQRNTPYSGFIQAFRSLIRQLLSESEVEIAFWREKLLAALGSNGQVIIEVIPEVELIIGPQPEAPGLPPAEAQNRFNLVFHDFIRTFTQPEHPLVIFLDDLQWADGASLKLMQLLMTAVDSRYLFLIGAYRDNEVGIAHPLMLALDEIKKADMIVNQISLAPLALADVTQFIVDTFTCDLDRATPLAELVSAKTGGNPFFMNEFLKSLYLEKLVRFVSPSLPHDLEEQPDSSQNGNWQWDLAQIQARNMTDNVVELVAGKIQQLPETTQHLLKLAACIGNQFDLQTLAVVAEKPVRETALELWSTVVEGLVLPLSNAYKLVNIEVEGLAEELRVSYKFAHDRIQQAVYSLISEQQKQVTHWHVGRLLLQNTPPETQDDELFNIVNQLNAGRALIDSQLECDELIELNLRAGRKAKTSAAYSAALDYLLIGIEMLGATHWKRQYSRNLALYEEAAEAAFLGGNYAEMEQCAEIVLQQARKLLDKVKVYEVLIQAHYAQGKYTESLETGRQVLHSLGVKLPEKPDDRQLPSSLKRINRRLAGRSQEKLADLPEMKDRKKLAAIRIMNSLIGVTWKLNTNLMPLIVCNQMNLLLTYGNSPEAPFVYANYGIVLNLIGDWNGAYQFGQLALNLLERFNATEFRAKTYMMTSYFTRHLKEPLPEIWSYMAEGYQFGRETGDLQYAGYCAANYCQLLFVGGLELSEINRQMAKYYQAIMQLGQHDAWNWHQIYWQGILNLMGYSQDPIQLMGDIYNEVEMLPKYFEVGEYGSLFHLFFLKVFLCYRFQAFQQAFEHLAKLEQFLVVGEGTALAASAYFYASLTRLAIWAEAAEEREQLLQKIAANQQKMNLWATHAPANYLSKFYLVEAEWARVLGKDGEAREYYDQAIALAQENKNLNEEALAYELAARFYLERGQSRLARYYMRDAHYAYQRWGAAAKVKDLETRYPQLLPQESLASTRISTTTGASETKPSGVLDLASVLKASQTISGEIVLEALLSKLMKIVIENAGAERGLLILERQGWPHEEELQWVIEAEGKINQPDVTILHSIPVEEGDLSSAIINYVARTRESVVLNDAVHEEAFSQDRYTMTRQPKSVLCMPLIHQGKLTGLLYLENNLTTGAFTADRLEVLRVLSSQAAVSLENARLYRNLAISEQRFRTLFENAPLAVFEVDLEQSPPQVLAANRQAELVYGWPAEAFAALPTEDLVPAEAAPQIRHMIARVRAGETITLETMNRRRDGTSFPVRMSATPEIGTTVHRMIVTVEDITLEKQRQAEVEAIEAERRRIAHEIHDGLAQDLAALRFKATLWHDLVDKRPAQMHAELDDLLEVLNGSIREVRRSIFALRPLALDELGFFPALRQFIANFGEQYQLQIKLRVAGPEERLPASLELPLFRVIQESLNNIRKHAQADIVHIHLDLEQAGGLSLTIQDNGIGFDPATLEQMFREGHVGLKQMQERVQSINGRLSIQSQPGVGTELQVTFPLA